MSDKVYSNLANTASLLWHAYKSMPMPLNAVNWSGKLKDLCEIAVLNRHVDPV